MTPQDFIKKYGISVTFEQLAEIQRKINKTSNFQFKEGAISFDKKNYIHGLKYMFSAYMKNYADPNNLAYDFSVPDDFNFIQFLRDYESAKQNEFEASNSTRKRQPFEGIQKTALNTLKELVTSYNSNLVGIWFWNIKRGANLDEFRRATIEAMDTYDAKIAQAREAYSETEERAANSSDEIKFANHEPIKVTYAVYKVMEGIINTRTWRWRLNPFNWSRLSEENRFMKDLKNKLGKETIRQMDANSKALLAEFEDNDIISDNAFSRFKYDVNRILDNKRGIYDKTSLEQKDATTNEMQQVAKLNEQIEYASIINKVNNNDSLIDGDNAINNNEINPNNIILDGNNPNDVNFDIDEINEDFANLSNNVEFFDGQDPNLYNAPVDADDIILLEDDVESAKKVQPVEKIADAKNKLSSIKENIDLKDEFKDNDVPKSAPVDTNESPVKSKIIE